MKNLLIVVLVLAVLVLGYLGRHQIKAMLGMGTTTPTESMQPSSSPEAMTANPSASPMSNNIYAWKVDAKKGNYLTDFQGMTLYVFDKDTTGVSNCSGACLVAWPAYSSGATAQGTFPEHISVITRADGTQQFAWDGKPLYYYAKDKVVGDLTGDGVGGTWHIVTATAQ